MQRAGISVPKLAVWIGVGGLLVATAASKLHAQQAEPPPPWKQGQPAAIADIKLAPIAPPPVPTALDKLPLDKLQLSKGAIERLREDQEQNKGSCHGDRRHHIRNHHD